MKLTIYANHLVPDGEVWVSPAGYEECATKLAKSQPTAPNTGSPKLPPCDCVRESIASKYLEIGYKYCHWCGRQLRASA